MNTIPKSTALIWSLNSSISQSTLNFIGYCSLNVTEIILIDLILDLQMVSEKLFWTYLKFEDVLSTKQLFVSVYFL